MIRISLTIEHYCEDLILNQYNMVDKVKECKKCMRDFLMIGQVLNYNLEDIEEVENIAGLKIVNAESDYVDIRLLNVSKNIGSMILNEEVVEDSDNIRLKLNDCLYLYTQNDNNSIKYVSICLNKIIDAGIVINI